MQHRSVDYPTPASLVQVLVHNKEGVTWAAIASLPGDNLDFVVVIQIGDGDLPAATGDRLLGSRWRLVARTPGGFDREDPQVSGQVRPGHVT